MFARTHAYLDTRKAVFSGVYDRERSQQLLYAREPLHACTRTCLP
jgi:hypothetical protein